MVSTLTMRISSVNANDDIFAECIGCLIATLKNNGIISFASISPFNDDRVQSAHYITLWNKYRDVIDYINFQLYSYDSSTTVPSSWIILRRRVQTTTREVNGKFFYRYQWGFWCSGGWPWIASNYAKSESPSLEWWSQLYTQIPLYTFINFIAHMP